MEIKAEAGSNIDLYAQLSDGASSMPLIIKSKVRGLDGAIISEVNLAHIGDGLFLNTLVMPDVPKIIAQHIVYEQDGITVSDDYDYAIQVFSRGSSDSSSDGSSSSGISDIQEIVAELSNIEDEYIVEVSHDNS